MASMNMEWKNKRQKRWYSDSTWVGSPVTLPILMAHLAQSEQNSPKHMSRFTRKMHPGKINIVWKIFWKCFLLSLRTRRCNWSEVISMYSRQGRWSAVNLVGPNAFKELSQKVGYSSIPLICMLSICWLPPWVSRSYPSYTLALNSKGVIVAMYSWSQSRRKSSWM